MSAACIIKAEGLGKKYTLRHGGNKGQRSLREVIAEKTRKFASGKFLQPTDEEFWALKNIHFEVAAGETIGIVGRNGAGKSTLLKILSRITEPTEGRVITKGRVASLLEVGTGFHQELTGRENIFLNGAILGMSRNEIRRKFDEIVDFSGVEKFLDTPVKHYSSGMNVRLAFAVAAHLEPEILIVDEVLAVGDAEFQKKCLGRMGEVSSKEGRTVLFVSHNVGAIKRLCTRGIFLENGKLIADDGINVVINMYHSADFNIAAGSRRELAQTQKGNFVDWELENKADVIVETKKHASFIFLFTCNNALSRVELGFVLRDNSGSIILSCNSRDKGGNYFDMNPGMHKFYFSTRLPIKQGSYEVDIILVSMNQVIDQWVPAKKLIIKSDFDTVLDERWQGVVNEDIFFSYAAES